MLEIVKDSNLFNITTVIIQILSIVLLIVIVIIIVSFIKNKYSHDLETKRIQQELTNLTAEVSEVNDKVYELQKSIRNR